MSEWIDYLKLADKMLLDKKYKFSYDIINNIKKIIEDKHYITVKQKKSLKNIFKLGKDNYIYKKYLKDIK